MKSKISKFIYIALICTLAIQLFCACSGVYIDESGSTYTSSKEETTSASEKQTSEKATTEGESDEPIVEMLIPKTGKSDCIIIFTGGKTVMIDTADDDDYVDISKCLKLRGIEKIDYLILSHFDKDHIGSAKAIMTNYEIGKLYMPEYVKDGEEYRSLMSYLELSSVERESLAGRETDFSIGEVKFTINSTSLYTTASTDSESNNCSLIVTAECGEMKLLFMGDAEKDRCNEFIRGRSADYDFIKLPHHGDCNKPLKNLIEDAHAKYSVICAASTYTVESELISRLGSAGTHNFITYEGDVHVFCGRKTINAYQD